MLGIQRHTTSRTSVRLTAALLLVGALGVSAACSDSDTKSDKDAQSSAAPGGVVFAGQWARTSPSGTVIVPRMNCFWRG
ncbi:MAG: hypothetical protein WCK21_11160 [Actinomycetota bacterium]